MERLGGNRNLTFRLLGRDKKREIVSVRRKELCRGAIEQSRETRRNRWRCRARDV